MEREVVLFILRGIILSKCALNRHVHDLDDDAVPYLHFLIDMQLPLIGFNKYVGLNTVGNGQVDASLKVNHFSRNA